jgi:hypothetical protein
VIAPIAIISAAERDTGAIEPQAGNSPERDAAIGQKKDDCGGDCEGRRFHFRKPFCGRKNIQLSSVRKI